VAVEAKKPVDGHIEIRFSENDFEARGDFYPPLDGGALIVPAYIDSVLDKYNISLGIKWEALDEAVRECTKELRIVKNILIAVGDPPVNEVSEIFQLNPTLKRIRGTPSAKEQVDHRECSPFIIVKKNESLAKYYPKTTGRAGKDVHGGAVPFEVIKPEGVLGGENTHVERSFLLSSIEGQMLLRDGVVSVSETLTIDGPVDYETGHINFPGNVSIEGPVSDGFKIYSGGSLTIKQTFDVTDSITRGDLSVAGGIIGRGRAVVTVGGDLKTKFIEHCKVACRKTVTVDSEIINSTIFTLESVEMNKKGTILGGEIYALKGVRVYTIGKESGKAARIHCGVDTAAQWGDKVEDLMHRLEGKHKKAQTAAAEIMKRIVLDRNATVDVAGEIAAGTLITIYQAVFEVTQPLKGVRFRLDVKSGRIVSEALQN
jgi:uncharacterized protein (DUF342 family)